MKIKRPLLIIFSPVYGWVTWLRNKFFDWGILKSTEFPFPVITVGNLNVGGTGKTPHTIWLLNLLHQKINTAVVSRGYGRETKGYVLATANSTAQQIGDEPKEITQRFPNISLAVAEKRVLGINKVVEQTSAKAIILDDAFQHRYAKAGLYILLSTYNDLYTHDYLLPGGNLRESKKGYKRADLIIVSKCPENLSVSERAQIVKEIDPLPHQKVAFTYYEYGKPLNIKGESVELPKDFLLLTGIAQTSYLTNYLKEQSCNFEHLAFKDHHNFTDADYSEMKTLCQKSKVQTILTTSKDFARLNKNHSALSEIEILHLPVDVGFIEGREEIEKTVLAFVGM